MILRCQPARLVSIAFLLASLKDTLPYPNLGLWARRSGKAPRWMERARTTCALKVSCLWKASDFALEAMRLPLDKWAAPLFLCPLLAQAPLHTFQPTSLRRRDQPCTRPQCRKQHVASFQPVDDVLQPELQSGIPEEGSTLTSGPLKGLPSLSLPKPVSPALLKQLPWSCPGCGAYTQLVEPDEAGYYSLTRKSVRSFLKAQRKREGAIESGQEILHHQAGPSGTLPQLLNNSSPKNSLPNGSTKGSEDGMHPAIDPEF